MNGFPESKRKNFGVCETHASGTMAGLSMDTCARCGHDIREHPVDLTTTLATKTAELAECEETLQFAAEYKGLEGRPCPLCTFEDGKFIKHCQMHSDLAKADARIAELGGVLKAFLLPFEPISEAEEPVVWVKFYRKSEVYRLAKQAVAKGDTSG